MDAKAKEHEQKRLIALQCLTRHDHSDWSKDTRESCGACVLNGYHPKGERRDFINYAGWARIYIQASKYIPKNIRYAFLAELASDNRAYADALKQDILDYGINCEFGQFKNAVREAIGLWD